MASQYEAGKCNIGIDEINYRRRIVGYGSAIILAALYTILVYFNFPLITYLVLIIPIFISGHGFKEAKTKFCTSYAKSGKYNMSSDIGITQDVLSGVKRKQDIKHANLLLKQSAKTSFIILILLIAASRLVN